MCLLSSILYPIVAHWAWSDNGWLMDPPKKISFLQGPEAIKFIDVAGSGIIHVTGGTAALIIVIFLSRRKVIDLDMEESSVSSYKCVFMAKQDCKRNIV